MANAFHPCQGTGRVWRHGRRGIGRVWIVTVRAGDVTRRINQIFRWVVDSPRGVNWMGTGLVEIRLDIFPGDIAVVTGKAVLLVLGVIQQPGLASGRVGSMAVLATVGGDGGFLAMRPWVLPRAVPRFGRKVMRRRLPGGRFVTCAA